MVAAARAVGVEVRAGHAVLGQVAPGRGVSLDGAGRGDVVGGHRVPQQGEHPGVLDVGDRGELHGQTLEEGGLAHVGGLLVPGEGVPLGGVQALPALVTGEDVGVVARVHLAVDGGVDDGLDLGGVGPDVGQEDIAALWVLAQRLGGEVDVHGPGQGVGDD